MASCLSAGVPSHRQMYIVHLFCQRVHCVMKIQSRTRKAPMLHTNSHQSNLSPTTSLKGTVPSTTMPPPGSRSSKKQYVRPQPLPVIREESRSSAISAADDSESAYDLPTVMEAQTRLAHDTSERKIGDRRRRRYILAGVLAVGVLMVLIISISVVVGKGKDDNTIATESQQTPSAPTVSPVEVKPTHTSVREILAPLVLQRGKEFDGNTYQSRVAEIMETDKVAAEYIKEDDATKLLQRYALFCLYEATGEWEETSWDVTSEECKWQGVNCDHTGLVHTLDLTGFGLSQELPPELSLMSLVWEHLILDRNPELGGAIPDFLTKQWLSTLSLRNTNFQGAPPENLCSNRLALTVDCDKVTCPANCCMCSTENEGNMSVPTMAPTTSGTSVPVPTSPTLTETTLHNYLNQPIRNAPVDLVDIDEVELESGTYRSRAFQVIEESTELSQFTPEQIVDRYALLSFYFATNELATIDETGSWATEWSPEDRLDGNHCDWHGVFCNASGRVLRLWLQNNNLSGFIPPELVLLTRLRVLNLVRNVGLAGALPNFLGRLPSYVRGDLAGTSYTSAPPGMCKNAQRELISGVLYVSCENIECPCCECKE